MIPTRTGKLRQTVVLQGQTSGEGCDRGMPIDEMVARTPGEPSANVRERVETARAAKRTLRESGGPP
jgi:hypothetical protein